MAQPQNQIIYAFVARGNTVLVEYTAFSGNFSEIAQQCLEKLPANNNKFTFPHGGHTLNYLLDNGFAYMVLCEEKFPQKIAFAFLERVKGDFGTNYAVKGMTAPRLGLNKQYGSKLKEHMKYVQEHPEAFSKEAKIQAQVQEVKGVMRENINAILQRGEKLENIADKTEELRAQATAFQKHSGQIKKKMWYENLRAKMVIIVLLIVVAVIIWLSVCRGFTCN